MNQHTVKSVLSSLRQINDALIGWNVYDTQRGPQPNMSRRRLTYTRDAFWQKRVSTEVVKSIIELLKKAPNEFSVDYDKPISNQEKFVIYLLSDHTLAEKQVVLKIHRKQLGKESVRLLGKLHDSGGNLDLLELYEDAKEKYAEECYGPPVKYKPGKTILRKLGSMTRPATQQISVQPVYH